MADQRGHPLYEAHDMTGKGAELSGGRWNRVGTALVYASTSRALACLETVVHLAADPLPLNRYLVAVSVPAAAWAAAVELDPATLVGWDAEPAAKRRWTGALPGSRTSARCSRGCRRSSCQRKSTCSSTQHTPMQPRRGPSRCAGGSTTGA